jgi:hypothetical protein
MALGTVTSVCSAPIPLLARLIRFLSTRTLPIEDRRRKKRRGSSSAIVAESGNIDDINHSARHDRFTRALAMLRTKTVEMPPRKHDNLPAIRQLPLTMTLLHSCNEERLFSS